MAAGGGGVRGAGEQVIGVVVGGVDEGGGRGRGRVGGDGGCLLAEGGEFAGQAIDLGEGWSAGLGEPRRRTKGRTTASCSFSSWRWRSVAVRGRG